MAVARITDSLTVEDGGWMSLSSWAGRRDNTSSAQLTMHEEKHLYKMGDDGSLYSNCVTYIKTEGVVIAFSRCVWFHFPWVHRRKRWLI